MFFLKKLLYSLNYKTKKLKQLEKKIDLYDRKLEVFLNM